MARRPYGDGSVYQEPSGRWVATFEVPARGDGKRRRFKKRASTKAEAQKLLRAMRGEADRGGGALSGQRTVQDATESFTRVREKKRLALGTRDEDAYLAALIIEGLGRLKLSRLAVADCDDFLSRCASGDGGRRPIGPAHMSKLRARLIAVLKNEMRTGDLGRNVAELSILPSRELAIDDSEETSERRALDRSELRALLESATESRLILVDLCGRNGLRPAEARSLRWEDLDLGLQELSVRGQQDRQNRRTNTKRAHNSSRTIALDDESIERLKVWAEDQTDMRQHAAGNWQEHGLVASTKVGTPVDRHSFARSIRLLCKRVGITPSITPYELRHTAISMQADAGRSSWEIADWAGTSEAMISRVYRHRLRRVSRLHPADD